MPAEAEPMRIAMMLESDGPGGAESVILRLSEELRHRGHHVLPVGPENGEGWLAEQFRKAGFAPATFSLSTPLDFNCLRGLIRTLRDNRINVVHSHEFTMAVYGAAAARWLKLRHVVTMHSSHSVTAVLRRRIALRWAFRNSAASVAVSDDTRMRLAEDLGIKAERLHVVPNGVPNHASREPSPDADMHLSPDEIVVIAVGTLIELKGHIHLLEAMKLLQERGITVPWRVVIAAGRGGDEQQKLEAFASEHGFADRLHILKYRTDVPQLLSAADIFVMPSLWEGLPMALLEAMLAGKPAVASGVGGIPEALRDGREGLLVAPANPSALATAIGQLMSNSSLRHALGKAARDRAEREFTTTVMADGYERLYCAATDGRSAPSKALR